MPGRKRRPAKRSDIDRAKDAWADNAGRKLVDVALWQISIPLPPPTKEEQARHVLSGNTDPLPTQSVTFKARVKEGKAELDDIANTSHSHEREAWSELQREYGKSLGLRLDQGQPVVTHGDNVPIGGQVATKYGTRREPGSDDPIETALRLTYLPELTEQELYPLRAFIGAPVSESLREANPEHWYNRRKITSIVYYNDRFVLPRQRRDASFPRIPIAQEIILREIWEWAYDGRLRLEPNLMEPSNELEREAKTAHDCLYQLIQKGADRVAIAKALQDAAIAYDRAAGLTIHRSKDRIEWITSRHLTLALRGMVWDVNAELKELRDRGFIGPDSEQKEGGISSWFLPIGTRITIFSAIRVDANGFQADESHVYDGRAVSGRYGGVDRNGENIRLTKDGLGLAERLFASASVQPKSSTGNRAAGKAESDSKPLQAPIKVSDIAKNVPPSKGGGRSDKLAERLKRRGAKMEIRARRWYVEREDAERLFPACKKWLASRDE